MGYVKKVIFGSPTNSDENEHSLPEYPNELNQYLREIHDFGGNKLQLTSNRMKLKFVQEAKRVGIEQVDLVISNIKEKKVMSKIKETLGRIQLSPNSKPNEVHRERFCTYYYEEMLRQSFKPLFQIRM